MGKTYSAEEYFEGQLSGIGINMFQYVNENISTIPLPELKKHGIEIFDCDNDTGSMPEEEPLMTLGVTSKDCPDKKFRVLEIITPSVHITQVEEQTRKPVSIPAALKDNQDAIDALDVLNKLAQKRKLPILSIKIGGMDIIDAIYEYGHPQCAYQLNHIGSLALKAMNAQTHNISQKVEGFQTADFLNNKSEINKSN